MSFKIVMNCFDNALFLCDISMLFSTRTVRSILGRPCEETTISVGEMDQQSSASSSARRVTSLSTFYQLLLRTKGKGGFCFDN